ncbi:hypothetical protein V2J09_006722 [Rumex salicifolius]
MSLLRSAQRCNQLLQSSHHISGVRIYQRSILRHLSTAGPDQPPQEEQPSIVPIPQTPTSSGPVYAKVFGINKLTLKTDIINLLESSNLTPDNVKVAHNRAYNPVSMLLQFPSMSEYASAVRAIVKRGRVYRLEKTGEREWDTTKSYDGKYVLLPELPLTTNQDDVHRFFEGYNYDSTTLDLFLRATTKDPIKMACVAFNTQSEAMIASIRKNGSFINNYQVAVRVLQ